LADRRDSDKSDERDPQRTRAKKPLPPRPPENIPSNFQIDPRHHSQNQKPPKLYDIRQNPAARSGEFLRFVSKIHMIAIHP
jgi:hypothetical protein